MQMHTLSNGEQIVLVTSHRRKSYDASLKHDHTIVGTVYNGFVMLAYAFCHRKDMYDKKEGRSVALDRLIHAIEAEKYDGTLVGCIPVADVIHFNIYESLMRIGVSTHEEVMAISEAIQQSLEEANSLKSRNLVLDAIDICEVAIGSDTILRTHRRVIGGGV